MPLALTTAGLSTQTEQEIKDELIAKLRATFGLNINTTTSSNFGQLVNIESEYRSLCQQTLLQTYASVDPDNATGTALDARCALTGTTRKGATSSTVVGILTFSGAGSVSNGDLIEQDGNGYQWEAIDGPYATTGGPYPEEVAATFSAVETGPKTALAGTAWNAVTGVPNLTGFTNPTYDADVGRDSETDPDLRVRRRTEIYAPGQGFRAAIKAIVSRVEGVEFVRVYHNPATSPADSDGIPFKAINVVVETNPATPGAALQQSIFDAILTGLAGGGEAYGTDYTGTAADVEGEPQPIGFDTVDQVPIYVSIAVTTSGTEQVVSVNMADVIEAAVLETANADFDNIGQDQLAYRYTGIVSDLQATGAITGAVTITVGISRISLADAISGGSDPVSIGIRERPTFDSTNIQATVT